MSCTATVRQSDDVVIVDLAGRLTLGEGASKVRETIRQLIQGGERRILLNLHDVSYIDSAGLGELVGSYAAMVNRCGQIKLLHADDKVYDVLRATKLALVFETFGDETEALRSFGRRAGRSY